MMSKTILISNMSCGGCAKGVLATLKSAAPEAQPAIDIEARRVTVQSSDVGALIAALRADGWEATEAQR